MRILFLTSRFPYPLEKGDKLRAHHQIVHLAERHDVTLVALSDQEVDPADLERIAPHCEAVHVLRRHRAVSAAGTLRALLRGDPLQVGYFDDPSAHRRIPELIRSIDPDVVFGQLVRTAPYLPAGGPRVVLDLQDAFSSITLRRAGTVPAPLRPLVRTESRRIAVAERAAVATVDAACIISAQDRDLLAEDLRDRVEVVPNGVDTQFFRPEGVAPLGATADVGFVGNMGYRPNVVAASYLVEQVLPELQRHRGRTSVLLSGARPARSVRALAGPGVTVTGWLDDVRSAYVSSRVLVAPLFTGAGQQNKILEAMSMGVPCVTSPLVNNAIGAEPGTAVLLASTPSEFAARTAELLDDADLAARVGAAGQDYVRSTYSWTTVVRRLEQLLAGPGDDPQGDGTNGATR